MANIQCACTGNKIRLKKKSPDRAMANASATIIGHQGVKNVSRVRKNRLAVLFFFAVNVCIFFCGRSCEL